MKNRFSKFAQDYIEEDYIKDNMDLLTLPDGAGEDPKVDIEESVDTGFPDIDWDFFENKPNPETFDDDVSALIGHLAELQVPMATIEKAIELIYENQGSEMQEEEPIEEQPLEEPESTQEQPQETPLDKTI